MNEMTIARKDIVDDQTPGFYHCTNRCVRRTFLCGVDELTGNNYSHRKDWLEGRMLELCKIFSVDIYAYAVMDNHYHIVLYLDPLAPQNWSKEDVAERWLCAYSGKSVEPEFAKQRELKKQAIIADKEKIKLYRERLGSLSWFMSRLNEPLAKQSNQEENCTGSFWEGRYSSQALLDEAAVLSCMTYVDLNPVRANITEKLEESTNTSIKKRLDEIKPIELAEVQATLDFAISAISNQVSSKKLSISFKSYIELVEWAGKNITHPNKAAMPQNISSCLNQLNLQQNHWLKQLENFDQHYCHVIGSMALIREKAKQLKKRCMKGMSAAQLLYEKTS